MLPSGWSITTNIESTAIRFGSDILSKQDKCSLVSAHDRIIALFHNDIMNTVLCLIWINENGIQDSDVQDLMWEMKETAKAAVPLLSTWGWIQSLKWASYKPILNADL